MKGCDRRSIDPASVASARGAWRADAFYKPEAVIARGQHAWVIDTYNDRVVLLRVESS